MLGIPTVMDRVIQQAVAQVLTPIFDPTFSESSFGFRPGRLAWVPFAQGGIDIDTPEDLKNLPVNIRQRQ